MIDGLIKTVDGRVGLGDHFYDISTGEIREFKIKKNRAGHLVADRVNNDNFLVLYLHYFGGMELYKDKRRAIMELKLCNNKGDI
jgi:hypothetical protein